MSNISFNVGEIIWAKIRGYPWWPAIITGAEDDNREKKYTVSFIGDHTHSSLAKKCLEKFTHMKPYYICPDFSNQNFF